MGKFRLQRLGLVMDSNRADPLEVEGVLNPAATRGPDGDLYLFPRLVARHNYSRIGIARVRFDETGQPASVERLGLALEPEADYERLPNGGGGCEDPRITFVEPLRRYVMTYTALSSKGPRIALAVSEDLFHWRRLGLARFRPYHGIDFDDVDNKDASVFPVADSRSIWTTGIGHLAPTPLSRNSSGGNGVPPGPALGESSSREHLDFLLLDENRGLRAGSPLLLWLASPVGRPCGTLGTAENWRWNSTRDEPSRLADRLSRRGRNFRRD